MNKKSTVKKQNKVPFEGAKLTFAEPKKRGRKPGINLAKPVTKPVTKSDKRKFVIIRSKESGVHFGIPVKRVGDEIVLKDSRRIWFWDGAATLSELATKGTSAPKNCKFPAAIPEITVLGICEIIPCTQQAIDSIQAVPVWTRH